MGERTGETFRSFGELKAAYDKSAESPEERSQRELAELHEDVLAGKYDKVPGADFDMKELGRYGKVLFGKTEGTSPGEGHLWVKVAYTKFDPQQRPHLATVDGFIAERDATGLLSARLPKGFPFSQKELSKLVLQRIGSMNLDKLHVTDLEAFPRTDATGRPRETGSGDVLSVEEHPIDPERQKQFEILRSMDGFLFEAIDRGQKAGRTVRYPYNGYHAFLYRGGFCLEGPEKGYAAYFVKFEDPLDVDDPRTAEGRETLVEKHVRSYLRRAETRQQLLTKFGARRVVHEGNWQERVAEHARSLSGAKG